MKLQLIFESGIDEDGEEVIFFIPNWDILPSHDDIDAIIERLNVLKEDMTDEQIKEHNEKRHKESEARRITQATHISEDIKPTRGYIYVLKSNGLYKIGKAKNIKERVNIYRTENPFGIELIYQTEVSDYSGVEATLLKQFKHRLKMGKEWFELDDRDLKIIKDFTDLFR